MNNCDEFCKLRHGRGYNQNDMLKLWKMYTEKRAEVNGLLKKDEVEELLVALDKQRGGAPEWRR